MSVSCLKKSLWTVVLGLVVGGCADSLIYTQDARRQGFADYNDGDYTDAIAVLQNVTQQDAQDYEAFYVMGESYEQNKSYVQAIAAYRTCMNVMPLTVKGQQDLSTHYKVMDKLATVIAESPSYDAEVTAMEKMCAVPSPSVDDLWMLAKTYSKFGAADEAVETYNKAVLIDSGRFDLTKEAGLYEANKNPERAAFTLKKAWEVNPNDDLVNSALHGLGVFPTLGGRSSAHI